MDWNSFWKKLIFPPIWLMLLFTVFSAAALVLIFVKGRSESPIAYAVYAIAFYTICVVSIFFAMVFPKRYHTIRQKIYNHPLGHRYMTDAVFKANIKLYASFAINLLYVGVNVLSWHLYRSMWFVILGAYYTILAVMRFLLVRYIQVNKIGQNRLGELQQAKLCSYILLLLNFVLTGAVMMILYQNKGYDYHGILIYVIASYTFYITIHAIVDLIKYRKYQSPVMTTSKIIALSAALVSMLNLETAMFSQFGGDMSAAGKWLMIALTGAGVSIAVIVMSVLMIVKSSKEIKEFNINGRE